MTDALLFPFLDIAVRAIAILVLCAIPLLIPIPTLGRVRSRAAPNRSAVPLTPD